MPKIFVLRLSTLLLALVLSLSIKAQSIQGYIADSEGKALSTVNIVSLPSGVGTTSNTEGFFRLKVPTTSGDTLLKISHLGYRSVYLQKKDWNKSLQIELESDPLGLEEVVLSANRTAVSRYNAPVIVETLKPQLFEQVAALSLSEGLSFSPGLRLENNCQNCGFTQLRINGLDGAYSQILLNSRPIFSSLMAVYGLEMIPVNMIERVEVVRGGGSALYGSNAIGGTVNIITKEARENQFYAQGQVQSIGGDAWESSNSIGASFASDDLRSGINLFAFTRDRDEWDANGDGFSEITQLSNRTIGLNSFWKPGSRSKISLDLFSINEYRRGGSDFDLLPHQSQIAEELRHQILGAGLAWEKLSQDGKHQFSIYTSGQSTLRDSYYGARGRLISFGDSVTESDLLALNAYGEARDYSFVGGGQYTWQSLPSLQLSIGSEYQLNNVVEEMPGYSRRIDQNVNSWGNYLQANWSISDKWKLQAGSRLDISTVRGSYALVQSDFEQDEVFQNLSPRLNLHYIANDNWQFRASYAQGFRVPQAFNEDLHIETVGGAVMFIQLDENLSPEISHSFNSSVDWLITNNFGEHKLLLTGFYTILDNPFVLIDREPLANGTAVQLKTNGESAAVRGISFEYQAALRNNLQVQASITAQEAFFENSQLLWDDETNDGLNSVSSDQFLRTPNLYGYLNVDYAFTSRWTASAALNYTGSMLLPRLVNLETEQIELLETRDFFDLQVAGEYQILQSKKWNLRLQGGVKNLFDAFQSDLPVGADRDATYIYGPILPRTYFLAIKVDFQPQS